jgi:hypothetical protein
MSTANKIGLVGVVALFIAAIITPIHVQPLLMIISLVCQWGGVLALVYAGIRGSRWWLAIPVIVLAIFFWALSRGH